MPVYEYRCRACGVRFERRQHISDEPLKVCPECGGEVYRLIQPVGIIFRGSGFYVTDNRAKSSTSGTGSSKKPSEKSEGKESESTDKSGTKSTTKSE
jgi:putative FmdB family regulatory protein